MIELRYKGHLLEHFDTEEAAHNYVDRRLADDTEGHLFDIGDWTVGPRKPIELHRAGSIVETFDTEEHARAHLGELLDHHVAHPIAARAHARQKAAWDARKAAAGEQPFDEPEPTIDHGYAIVLPEPAPTPDEVLEQLEQADTVVAPPNE